MEHNKTFLINPLDFGMTVAQGIQLDLEKLQAAGCVIHPSIESLYTAMQAKYDLQRDEVEGTEVSITINPAKYIDDSENTVRYQWCDHAHPHEIDLMEGQSIEDYLISFEL